MKIKLLLADDEEDIREVFGIYLADMGYDVSTAENGNEALRIFREKNPSIVLTDIKMPGMDGVELLGKIKQENPDTEVIMITGHGDMDLAIQCLKYEATDFVTKPINDDVLEIALKRAKEKISMRNQIRAHNENLHRLVQEELRVTREKYHRLFNESPCYISVQDRKFRITAANRRFREDFGQDMVYPCFSVYKHRETRCEGCPVEKTFEDGNSHQSEMVVTSKSGEQYNVLIRTAPIRNAEGEISEVMEMSTNITQIRQLQDHLSSLGLLIGSVSHGIKGLLTGLDGGMYLLNSGFAKENQGQIKEGWETVKLMVKRIRSMVLDILYYAKERNLQWERVDVIAFADDLAFTVEPRMEKHRIAFVREFDAAAGMFEIDPGIVHPALINILENAVDACVEDLSEKSHKIVFSVKQDKENIIFEVHDDGIGMSRETKENIFTLFFSSKGHRGTGLGLFVSNKIIQKHGGSIEVWSEPGQGSHFRVRIPKILSDDIKSANFSDKDVKGQRSGVKPPHP